MAEGMLWFIDKKMTYENGIQEAITYFKDKYKFLPVQCHVPMDKVLPEEIDSVKVQNKAGIPPGHIILFSLSVVEMQSL